MSIVASAPAGGRRPSSRAVAAIALVVLLVLAGALLAGSVRAPTVAAPGNATGPPNVIVVLTDDLDVALWNELSLRNTIGGRSFANAFVTSPLCCPSKASFLTGLYTHNHGVWATNPPMGGLYAALQNDLERSTLPVWLQRAGYRTGFMGRYLVGYGWRDSPPSYVPPGWDTWIGRVSPTPEGYRDIAFSFDGTVRTLPGDEGLHYLPQAQAFIRSAGTQPFFLVLAPMAPHAPWGEDAGYPGDPSRRAATMQPIEQLVTELVAADGAEHVPVLHVGQRLPPRTPSRQEQPVRLGHARAAGGRRARCRPGRG